MDDLFGTLRALAQTGLRHLEELWLLTDSNDASQDVKAQVRASENLRFVHSLNI